MKGLLTVFIASLSAFAALVLRFLLPFFGFKIADIWACCIILPLLIPVVWVRRKKMYLGVYALAIVCIAGFLVINSNIRSYNKQISIDVTPNIAVGEYLPFKKKTKIVKYKSKTLNFRNLDKKDLPRIDGATAAFPVYSAFVHAVYPDTTKVFDKAFQYNNTVGGYEKLAKKKTDIFIGAYPSKEQIKFAEKHDTEFKYTQIGSEAFVFFVHKDNPVERLTVEQIQGIYSGEITNWKDVGGKFEKIVPFQRAEDSGSQSMLKRFMGDVPIIEPDMDERIDGMGGIIKEVADYKNKSTSIGFSFRFYVESIIKNPDIKLIAINGIKPTIENIKNNAYPIIAPVYAVTYAGNTNKNVKKLVDWMLTEEGQKIIEETGYVGVK